MPPQSPFSGIAVFYKVVAGKPILKDFKNDLSSTSGPSSRGFWLTCPFISSIQQSRPFGPKAARKTLPGLWALAWPWCIYMFCEWYCYWSGFSKKYIICLASTMLRICKWNINWLFSFLFLLSSPSFHYFVKYFDLIFKM